MGARSRIRGRRWPLLGALAVIGVVVAVVLLTHSIGPSSVLSTSSGLTYDPQEQYVRLDGALLAERHGATVCYSLKAHHRISRTNAISSVATSAAPYGLVLPSTYSTGPHLGLADTSGHGATPGFEAMVWLSPHPVPAPAACGSAHTLGVVRIEGLGG